MGRVFRKNGRLRETFLRKVLGNARLNFDELFTVLVEVEGTLNSRAITYEYDETSKEVLTRCHLLFGGRVKTMPGR